MFSDRQNILQGQLFGDKDATCLSKALDKVQADTDAATSKPVLGDSGMSGLERHA